LQKCGGTPPKSIQKSLPEHAQEIYLAAYNNTSEQYTDPDKRRGKVSLEEIAHKVAWATVKKEYHKVRKTGEWRKNSFT